MLPVILSQASVDNILFPIAAEKDVNLFMLRLDKIHPVISGNKWFKLKYHLDNYEKGVYAGLLTFGGAYSNHLVATACAAHYKKIKCTGIVRGEKPAILSHSLQTCLLFGMQLEFTSRENYRQVSPDTIQFFERQFPDHYIIPEGGAGYPGEKGCREILDLVNKEDYTHIACAIGTATMYSGIANSSMLHQKIIGIPVLKVSEDSEIFNISIDPPAKQPYCSLIYHYHSGGYARHNPELLSFMNVFYNLTSIPTDFVYTAKLAYAITDLVKQDYFPTGSKVLLIHSGGLQGNESLPKGTLIF